MDISQGETQTPQYIRRSSEEVAEINRKSENLEAAQLSSLLTSSNIDTKDGSPHSDFTAIHQYL